MTVVATINNNNDDVSGREFRDRIAAAGGASMEYVEHHGQWWVWIYLDNDTSLQIVPPCKTENEAMAMMECFLKKCCIDQSFIN